MSDHNITVEGGSSVRLPTAGKYCDRDIVVSATPGGIDLPQLTNEGTAPDLMKGKQLIDGSGNVVDGEFSLDGELSDQDLLLAQIQEALRGKAASDGDIDVVLQRKTATPSKTTQEITADADYTALEKVTVEPIPSEYIVPSGTKEITKNGTHDAAAYESVSVNVPIPDGYIIPSGELEIAENGTHDVTQYASVNVNVNVPTEPEYKSLYQRVEYITSAEEETYPYIITDFYGDNSCGMEIIASFPKMHDRIPMGSREDSGTTRFYCLYPLSTSTLYYGFNTGSSISGTTAINTIYRLQTNFLNSRLVNCYKENGARVVSASLNATLKQQSAPVSIFGYHSASSGAVSNKREYKLYSARCSRGHEVVREYIPCYRKSDGEVGLYEKITGQFLTNDGTGAFTKGADIDW